MTKSLNAEVLKVCKYKLTTLVRCFQQQPREKINQRVSIGCLPEYLLGLFSTASTLPPRTVSESLSPHNP